MDTKRLLKVLDQYMRSPYKGFLYELGKWYECGDFDMSDKDCSRGHYATGFEGLLYAFRPVHHCRVFEAEVGGRRQEFDQCKRRFEKIKLVRELTTKQIKAGLRRAGKAEGYNLLEATYPINPLRGRPKKVQEQHIATLRQWALVGPSLGPLVGTSVGWASVGASVRSLLGASVESSLGASVWDWAGNSVWASVGTSVGASVRASVRASLGASVRASVRASVGASVWAWLGASVRALVWAYVSSLFPGVTNWKYFEHKPGENPFQSGIDLWRAGFVPSFNGATWRLHSGKNASIVYEAVIA